MKILNAGKHKRVSKILHPNILSENPCHRFKSTVLGADPQKSLIMRGDKKPQGKFLKEDASRRSSLSRFTKNQQLLTIISKTFHHYEATSFS
jgi:hypothetical protein